MNRLLFVIISFFIFTLSNNAFCGDVKAGEERYAQNCGNCHGPGGMGLASYPKIKGKEIPYLVDRLNTYRAGTRIGPNSDLMIMKIVALRIRTPPRSVCNEGISRSRKRANTIAHTGSRPAMSMLAI